ncbi:hypothetical protein QBC44DRAFT_377770 [Cladorrhinum sp. PSN332]|nr:hypothetical protein QBC44DRAFT_377770 [Cladorrhinum sp. PSN332]
MASNSQNPPIEPNSAPASGANDTQAAREFSFKRPADDDDIEFISSNPIKKIRSTTPDRNPHPEAAHQTAIDRCQSTGPIGFQSNIPAPENRGASLPVFRNFAFPQYFPPISQPPRSSVAISPKQMLPSAPPQTAPSLGQPPSAPSENTAEDGNTIHRVPRQSEMPAPLPPPPPPPPPPQTSPGFDQVPCLGFNGISANTPKFNLGQISSSLETTFMAGSAPVNNPPSHSMTPPPLPTPPFLRFNTQSAIPFAMSQTSHASSINQHLPQLASSNSLQNVNPAASGMNNIVRQHQNPQAPDNLTQIMLPCLPFAGSNNDNKPPCLHCIRQERLRQAQTLPPHSNSSICKPIQPPTLTQFPTPTPSSQPLTSSEQAPTQSTQHQPQPSGPASSQSNPLPVPFTIPKRHKPSPNLYIDIAETVEEVFPYDNLATRHNITPHKVFEALSAVILVPLLRYPTDKRRASKLAHDRVKAYQLIKGEIGKLRSDRVEVAEVVAHTEDQIKKS